jgi:AP2-associated kinase
MSIGKSAVVELKVGSFSISVKNRLAEGGFGFVDLVYETSSKQEYVLKRAGIERPEIYEIVKKEINILQRFSGPHMVKLLASDVIVVNKGKKEACLLLEFCPGGHLLERLNNRGGKHLPPASVYKIFGQLLLALKPMHESMPPVTHRDLKLENILFGTV